MPQSTLIYDGDCGVCTLLAKWAEARLPSTTVVAPWQALDLASFGLTETEVTTALYWQDASGRLFRGHMGVAKALQAMGPLYRVIGTAIALPPLRWIAAVVYPLVAANRHRLPGSTDACKLDLGDPVSSKRAEDNSGSSSGTA